MLDEDDDENLSCKVGVAITFLGLILRLEMLLLEIKDASVNELSSTEFPHKTKHRSKVLRLKIPSWLVSTLTKHIGQFKIVLTKKCALMRNYHSKSMTHTQNMGKGKISKFASVLAHNLEKDNLKKSQLSHSGY